MPSRPSGRETRYLVGADAKLRAVMLKWLPDRLQDWILKKVLETTPALRRIHEERSVG